VVVRTVQQITVAVHVAGPGGGLWVADRGGWRAACSSQIVSRGGVACGKAAGMVRANTMEPVAIL
jgi:hypothetical protein